VNSIRNRSIGRPGAWNIATISLVCATLGASLGATSAMSAPSTTSDDHAGHHPEAATVAPAALSMNAADPRMKAMRDMHQKMMNAKTPDERNALMADHMKAMKDGMEVMRGMQGKGGMPEAGGKYAESAMHHDMMDQRMDMMQSMMEMMMDRMAVPAGK
jgi:hypothetical protein